MQNIYSTKGPSLKYIKITLFLSVKYLYWYNTCIPTLNDYRNECMMNTCLIDICETFEKTKDFLSHRSVEKEKIVTKLFYDFLDCFSSLKAEKLEYPKEFQNDIKLYLQGHAILKKKFEDVEIRYLMLSDFYDFCRLTKRYPNKKGNRC